MRMVSEGKHTRGLKGKKVRVSFDREGMRVGIGQPGEVCCESEGKTEEVGR